jgi:DEAD/DEAH box helicase domain-containing protein
MQALALYQPLGFRTDYRQDDYDDADEDVSTGGYPELAATVDPTSAVRVGGLWVTVAEQAPVITINDNRGQLFSLVRMPDKSVVADDSSLYPDGHSPRTDSGTTLGSAAIGEVRPSDVTILALETEHLIGGLIPTASGVLPAGLAAFHSFAEILKRGAHADLDIHPDELEVGLQPIRSLDIRTHRIFLADSLENGAGYATELGRPERLSAVLERVLAEIAYGYEAPDHRDQCDSSCPNCLRSWDNRRFHGALDWRLGLDVAELAAGRAMRVDRWLERAAFLSAAFAAAFGPNLNPVEHFDVEGLRVIAYKDRSRAVLLGHPLWRHETTSFNDRQAEAYASLEELGYRDIRAHDLYELSRAPFVIYQALAV